jgi:hypothetical protein
MMADHKAVFESMSRRGVVNAREGAAKRQRVLFFTVVGIIVVAMGLTQFWSAGRVQHPTSTDQLQSSDSH